MTPGSKTLERIEISFDHYWGTPRLEIGQLSTGSRATGTMSAHLPCSLVDRFRCAENMQPLKLKVTRRCLELVDLRSRLKTTGFNHLVALSISRFASRTTRFRLAEGAARFASRRNTVQFSAGARSTAPVLPAAREH
jgi:hypothetical protein